MEMTSLRDKDNSFHCMGLGVPSKRPEMIEKLAAKLPSETSTNPSLRRFSLAVRY